MLQRLIYPLSIHEKILFRKKKFFDAWIYILFMLLVLSRVFCPLYQIRFYNEHNFLEKAFREYIIKIFNPSQVKRSYCYCNQRTYHVLMVTPYFQKKYNPLRRIVLSQSSWYLINLQINIHWSCSVCAALAVILMNVHNGDIETR